MRIYTLGNICYKRLRMCPACRKQYPVHSLFMTYHTSARNKEIWYLQPFRSIVFLIYPVGQFYCFEKRSTRRRPSSSRNSLKRMYHIKLYRVHLAMSGIQAHRVSGVCMEHIICDTLIALLIFDFLNAIRKLRHMLYCNGRVLLWHLSCIEYILPWAGFKLIELVVIGTDYTCSRKSNYQSITTTMPNWSLLTDIWHEMFTKQVYCIVMVVFYYDIYSFTRAIPPCLVNISCHMSVNRDQLGIVVVIMYHRKLYRVHLAMSGIHAHRVSGDRYWLYM
jgi:hypothetical protein